MLLICSLLGTSSPIARVGSAEFVTLHPKLSPHFRWDNLSHGPDADSAAHLHAQRFERVV